MVFIQSNDRKGRYEFRAIQESCKMRSMYKNEIRAKQENNDTCKSVIHTQHLLSHLIICKFIHNTFFLILFFVNL